MKQPVLILLIEELNKVLKKQDEAIKNQDLMMKLVWSKVEEILKEVIKKVQDRA